MHTLASAPQFSQVSRRDTVMASVFSNNSIALSAIKIALTLAFLAFGGLYVWAERDAFLALEWPSAFALLVVASMYVVNLWLRATYNLITARHLGTSITAGESFMISAVVAAGNFLLPAKAGAGLRALYMKKVHGFPVSHFASSSLIFLFVTVLVVSVSAVLLVTLIYFSLGYFRLDLSLLFPVASIVVVLSIVALRPNADRWGSDTWTSSFFGSLFAILRERLLVASAAGIALLVFFSSALAWTVAVREFAPETAVLEAFLLAASQIVAGFVTLTPGATGFQELAGLYVGRSFAASITEIFAALIWVRLVRIAVSIVIAIPSVIVLRGRLRDATRDGVPA